MSDAEELERLRKRLARTENIDTLHRLGDTINDLGVTCAENMLGAVADLRDRCANKIERLGGTSVRRRPAIDTEIEMPVATGDDPLLQKLCAVHGEARFDIAPELVAAATRRTP
jgi:hypothetical protein